MIFSGTKNPSYNKELTDLERTIGRKYEEYYKWRLEVYRRDNFTCQICQSNSKGINAHHIESYKTNKEKRTDIDNGITLCVPCHKEFHKIYTRFNNNLGQLIEFKNKKKE